MAGTDGPGHAREEPSTCQEHCCTFILSLTSTHFPDEKTEAAQDSKSVWGPVELAGTKTFFCLPLSCRPASSLHDLPLGPKGRFEQLLIKRGAAEKPPEARLYGRREAHQ